MNIKQSDLLITTSGPFTINQRDKNVIFYVKEKASNPSLLSASSGQSLKYPLYMESMPSCSPLKLIPAKE